MKRVFGLLLFFVGCLGTSLQAWCADCSPSDITITSQADVDNFQSLFGGGVPCDRVAGNLKINNVNPLTNLEGLTNLKEIAGDLEINNNDAGSASNSSNSLVSLGGLSHLAKVGGHFELLNNSQLSQCRWIAELLGWPDGEGTASVGGYIIVGSNSEGCNSVAEIYAGATANVDNLSIGPEHTGSWYYPEQSGHGFSIEYGDDGNGTPLVVVYWYVYDKDGAPVFLTGFGYPDESGVNITFNAHYGMKFGEFYPSTHQEPDGGTARFTFVDANNGTFEYYPSDWTVTNFGHSSMLIPISKLFDVSHPDQKEPTPVKEIEFNDEQAFATVFQLGDTIAGNLSGVTDVDWFAVNISSEQTGMVAVNFNVSSVDSGLWSVDWYDPNMTIMSGRNLSAPEGLQYEFPAFTAGTYYLRIMIELDFLYNGATYEVTLTKVP